MTTAELLKSCGIDRADAEVLLAHLLKIDRSTLFAHPERMIEPQIISTFTDFCTRAKADEPLAYIIGTKEFYHQTYRVNRDVLIPRPSTELLVESFLKVIQMNMNVEEDFCEEIDSKIVAWSKKIREGTPNILIDIGTGSGCIICTLSKFMDDKKLPTMELIATDISEKALKVAEENIQKLHCTGITLYEGDLLEALPTLDEPFWIISNPPYIQRTYTLESTVSQFEPHLALFGEGGDGGDIVRTLTKQCREHPNCIGWTIECKEDQIS